MGLHVPAYLFDITERTVRSDAKTFETQAEMWSKARLRASDCEIPRFCQFINQPFGRQAERYIGFQSVWKMEYSYRPYSYDW